MVYTFTSQHITTQHPHFTIPKLYNLISISFHVVTSLTLWIFVCCCVVLLCFVVVWMLCCDVLWCDVMWCDVMWCDVMWCDVMWCDVMWYDVLLCVVVFCFVVVWGVVLCCRPHLNEFLGYAFDNYDVGVWSSAMQHNVDWIIQEIFINKRSQLKFEYNRTHCTLQPSDENPYATSKPLSFIQYSSPPNNLKWENK